MLLILYIFVAIRTCIVLWYHLFVRNADCICIYYCYSMFGYISLLSLGLYFYKVYNVIVHHDILRPAVGAYISVQMSNLKKYSAYMNTDPKSIMKCQLEVGVRSFLIDWRTCDYYWFTYF